MQYFIKMINKKVLNKFIEIIARKLNFENFLAIVAMIF
jgi:hypothetical protein